MRTGSTLLKATREFAVEDRARTWRLLLVTLAVVAGSTVGAILLPWEWAQLLAGVAAGLSSIRLFIFYHDHLHGAILRGSRCGEALMSAVGLHLLAVRSVWRETHNYHHRNNARITGSSIGSFPVVTVETWRGMGAWQRLVYRAVRHPLSIFGGYLTVFLAGMTISAFRRDPRKHWAGPVALALHVGAMLLVGSLWGPFTAFCGVVLPLAVALGLGSYLFYAQHNFPDMKLKGREDWDYTFAALHSSSMFEMGPVMHWVTGNIGFHHVHHLNHLIPFYNLPAAMAATPELQTPGRTSWRPRDVVACLSLALWDQEADRMLTRAEAAERLAGSPIEPTAG